MSVEFDRESPGNSDSRTLNRKTIHRWTGRIMHVFMSLDVILFFGEQGRGIGILYRSKDLV